MKKRFISTLLVIVMLVAIISATFVFASATEPSARVIYNARSAILDGANTNGEYDEATTVLLNAYGNDTDGDKIRIIYTSDAISVLVEVFDDTVVNYSDTLNDGTTKAGSSNCDFAFLGFSIGNSFKGIKRVYRGGAGRSVFQPTGTYVDMSEGYGTNGELETKYFAHVNNVVTGFTLEARFPVDEMSAEDQAAFENGTLEVRFTAGSQDGENKGNEFTVSYDGDVENRGWDGAATEDYFAPSNNTGYKAKNPSAYTEYAFGSRENYIPHGSSITFDGVNTDGEYDDALVIPFNSSISGTPSGNENIKVLYTGEGVYILFEAIDDVVDEEDFLYVNFKIGSTYLGHKLFKRAGANDFADTYDKGGSINIYVGQERLFKKNSTSIGWTVEMRFPIDTMNATDKAKLIDGSLEVAFSAAYFDNGGSGKNGSSQTQQDAYSNFGENGDLESCRELQLELSAWQEYEVGGSCGDNMTWVLNRYTGVITISGTGNMYPYSVDYEDGHSNVPWYEYKDAISTLIVEQGVNSLGIDSFKNIDTLKNITFASSVTTIGGCAFEDCDGITSVTIPSNVTHIQWGAFRNCSNLKTIIYCGSERQWNAVTKDQYWDTNSTITVRLHNYVAGVCTECNHENKTGSCGDSVTWTMDFDTETLTIRGTGDMYNYNYNYPYIQLPPWEEYVDSVKTVIIENGVTSIGDSAFAYCHALTSVTITGSVTTVGESSFEWCDALTSITIPNSVTSIEGYAFLNCEALTSITIPNGVTSIEEYAFLGCSSLTKLTMSNSVTSIGTRAFDNCSLLTQIIYCGTESEWNYVAKAEDWYISSPITVQFHNLVDGVCTECGNDELPDEDESIVIPMGASVSLGENLNVNYYVDLSDAYLGAQMHFTMNGKETIVDGVFDETTGCYVFTFKGIAPQCMGDTIKAELIYEGDVIAIKESYSILQNAENLLTNYSNDKDLVDLIKAMLNYGAAAQKYAKYKTDALVNAGYEIDAVVPDSSVSIREVTNNSGDGVFKAAGVYFDSRNRLYVKILSEEMPTVTINGVEAVVEEYGNGEWIVFTDGIFVGEFDKAYTFVITSNSNLPTLTYSVNSYTYAKQTSEKDVTRELATATYAYGVAAEKYIEDDDIYFDSGFNSEDDTEGF